MNSKLRYAFVALAAVMLALAVVNVLYAANQAAGTGRKFCQVITGFTAVPVPKPADPAANPSREQAYEWYVRFTDLGRSLGC